MNEILPELLRWFNENPELASLLVFLISFGESLLVVGLFILGTPIMLGFGVLVGLEVLSLWPTLFAAFMGAVLGDGISFWIGYRYHEAVRRLWPFNKHPEWLGQAEVFFHKHGGKSVAFGRFFGPVRSFIPTVAGMFNMPPARFVAVDVVSALLWAPSFILPGVLLGASLTLVAGVATRLIILLGIIVAVLWLVAWVVRRTYGQVMPMMNSSLKYLLAWLNQHPLLKHFSKGILDTQHPHILALFEFSFTLVLASGVFIVMLGLQLASDLPFVLDRQVTFLFQGLHTPWANYIMLFINGMHNLGTTLGMALLGLSYLALKRQWQGFYYWGFVLVSGMLSAWLIQQALFFSVPEGSPVYDYTGFADVRITLSTLVYGFLAVLIAGELQDKPTLRRLPYTAAAWWVVSLILARLYLEQQWLSDTLLGFTLGLIWVAVIGLAYRRHHVSNIRIGHLGLWMSTAFLALNLWHYQQYDYEEIEKNLFKPTEEIMLAQAWWQLDWEGVAHYQTDWGGRAADPMTLQWGGKVAKLEALLLAEGWQKAPPFSLMSSFKWLSPDSSLKDLPLLPRVHQSRHEQHAWVYYEKDSRLILRLWSSHMYLTNVHSLVWVGNITRERLEHPLAFFTLPVSQQGEILHPLDYLPQNSKQLCWAQRQYHLATADPHWQGEVLLGWKQPCFAHNFTHQPNKGVP